MADDGDTGSLGADPLASPEGGAASGGGRRPSGERAFKGLVRMPDGSPVRALLSCGFCGIFYPEPSGDEDPSYCSSMCATKGGAGESARRGDVKATAQDAKAVRDSVNRSLRNKVRSAWVACCSWRGGGTYCPRPLARYCPRPLARPHHSPLFRVCAPRPPSCRPQLSALETAYPGHHFILAAVEAGVGPNDVITQVSSGLPGGGAHRALLHVTNKVRRDGQVVTVLRSHPTPVATFRHECVAGWRVTTRWGAAPFLVLVFWVLLCF